jgi:CelD/BcsL family acetyltransferase involved in cellulose biosynthesis
LSKGEADLAYLNFLREDSSIYKQAKKLPGVLSRDHIGTTQQHYTASLPECVEDLHKSLSPKVRKNHRWNRMKEDFPGAIRIECFQCESEVDNLAEIAEEIARHSYQRELGVGFVNTEGERQRLYLKAKKGWLRGYVLYIGEEPAAFWIGDINQGVFGGDYIGFDPAFGKYSPGIYLALKVIEGFCGGAEKVIAVDFATGHADYKAEFSNCVWEETDVYIFARSFKGITLNLIKSSAAGTAYVLKKVLERTGLLKKIKKRWREHLRTSQQCG